MNWHVASLFLKAHNLGFSLSFTFTSFFFFFFFFFWCFMAVWQTNEKGCITATYWSGVWSIHRLKKKIYIYNIYPANILSWGPCGPHMGCKYGPYMGLSMGSMWAPSEVSHLNLYGAWLGLMWGPTGQHIRPILVPLMTQPTIQGGANMGPRWVCPRVPLGALWISPSHINLI